MIVNTVNFKKDDVLVFSVEQHLSQTQFDDIRVRIQARLTDAGISNKFMLIDGSMASMQVLSLAA